MKEPYCPPREPRSRRRRILKKYFKNICRWMYWDMHFSSNGWPQGFGTKEYDMMEPFFLATPVYAEITFWPSLETDPPPPA